MKKFHGFYKISTIVLSVAGVAYLLLLSFPQALFAYSTEHGKFRVHSREPLTPEIEKVLDTAEARLQTSPIYDDDVRRDIYLTNGFGMYAFLSHKAYKSFANSVPFINNVFINKTDVPADRVFVNRPENNSRSLSGVIAHETVHLFIRKRYGTVSATLMPTWKNEGYCEYVAGDSTITIEEGIRRWKESPSDDTGYRYTKYRLMVKQLLDNEKITVDEFFKGDFDEKQVAGRTLAAF
jgi:hypothetical protein